MPNRDPSLVSGGGDLDTPYLSFSVVWLGLRVVGDGLRK